jgi:hypothetical protein
MMLLFFYISSAQSVEGYVFDKKKQTPVVFASVYTTQNTGVITNQEGAFKIKIDNLSEIDSLIITSLGYEKYSLAYNQLNNLDTIFLKEQKEMLNDVVISANKLSANQIIQKFKDSISQRHFIEPTQFKIFKRTHYIDNPKSLEVEINKSSFMTRKQRKSFNDKIVKYFKDIDGNISNTYEDLLYNAYYFKDSMNVDYVKGTKLINLSQNTSVETLQKEVFKELLTALDTESTFKVKSGLFTVDDSLSTKKFIQFSDNSIKDTLKNSTTENSALKSLTHNLPNHDIFEDLDHYKFKLIDTKLYEDEVVYVLSFAPDHRKAKYQGNVYINAVDFGLMRMDYRLIEGEKEAGRNMKFLLGIKYRIDQSEYQIIYQKHKNNIYYPKYFRSKYNQYVYVDRNIKFKENIDDRSERIQLKLDFHVENNNQMITEFLFMSPKPIDKNNYSFDKNGFAFSEYIKTYDPKIWEEYDIIQVTEGIKNYEY